MVILILSYKPRILPNQMPAPTVSMAMKAVVHTNRDSMVMARTRTYDPTDIGMNDWLASASEEEAQLPEQDSWREIPCFPEVQGTCIYKHRRYCTVHVYYWLRVHRVHYSAIILHYIGTEEQQTCAQLDDQALNSFIQQQQNITRNARHRQMYRNGTTGVRVWVKHGRSENCPKHS